VNEERGAAGAGERGGEGGSRRDVDLSEGGFFLNWDWVMIGFEGW